MLKFIYEGKNYNYGSGIGKQPYDIKTEIDVIEDANIQEAIDAFLKIMQIATYRIEGNKETILSAIEDYFEENF